jgi:hypothetical protein
MISNSPPAARTVPSPDPVDALALAKAEALDALRAILRKDDASDREKRLAATAILKYAAAVEPPPPPPPLPPDEDDDDPDNPYAPGEKLLRIAYEQGYADHTDGKPLAPITLGEAAYEDLARYVEAQDAADDDEQRDAARQNVEPPEPPDH